MRSPAPLKNFNCKLSYSRKVFRQKDYARKAEIALAKGFGDITRVPYHPFISIRFNSSGFCSRLVDPVTGELIHTLSNGESDWVRSLLWLNGHAGMYSQIRIPRQDSMRLATQLRYLHPLYPDGKTPCVMTTDLGQIVEVDGKRILTVYSIKNKPRLSERDAEKLEIEAAYWAEQEVERKLLFRSDVNSDRIENIRWIENYLPSSPLVPGRKQWRQIEAVLYPLVSSGIALNTACHRADALLGLKDISLAQVRFYLAARIWTVDFDVPINAFRPLPVLERNLEAL